jgi:hypothetical protein
LDGASEHHAIHHHLVPVHLHSRVYDMFFGVKGVLEIRYEGQHGHGTFELRPGAFCAVRG